MNAKAIEITRNTAVRGRMVGPRKIAVGEEFAPGHELTPVDAFNLIVAGKARPLGIRNREDDPGQALATRSRRGRKGRSA